MKIVSWNINSLRLRLHLLEKLFLSEQPDIICLQETKVRDSDFPIDQIKKIGFKFIYFSGEKSYNGVALLSKLPLTEIKTIDVLNCGHKRHIAATLPNGIILHNFYVPAGGDIPDPKVNPKFDLKLKFIDWMGEYFSSFNPSQPIIMLGDINVAPLPNDVWSHKQLLQVVSHTLIEIEKINLLQKTLNWVDSHRLFTSEEQKLYSWWSYRAVQPLKSDRGRRLDHIWTTPVLKKLISNAQILKDYRLLPCTSDHVPITIELN